MRFSLYTKVYTSLFVATILFLPMECLAFRAKIGPVATELWGAAALFEVLILALISYANGRCSGERMTYGEGLMVVSSSMMTGWSYSSMLFVWPALFFVLFASIALSVWGDLTGRGDAIPGRYLGLVRFFYDIRMRH
jgi:hypothetical protein